MIAGVLFVVCEHARNSAVLSVDTRNLKHLFCSVIHYWGKSRGQMIRLKGSLGVVHIKSNLFILILRKDCELLGRKTVIVFHGFEVLAGVTKIWQIKVGNHL